VDVATDRAELAVARAASLRVVAVGSLDSSCMCVFVHFCEGCLFGCLFVSGKRDTHNVQSSSTVKRVSSTAAFFEH
jgi:hypothetical protein